jgi:Stage II sporulation protein E (SpoIIE)/GAF domain
MRGRTSRKPGGARRGGETRLAVASAAGLYVIGAALIATTFLLPEVSSPAGAAGVAGTAVLTAVILLLAVTRARPGLTVAWAAELWGVVIIAVLCASTGGANSPFALLYFFAIGHAAAFQPPRRFELTAAAGLLAFLAPLVYSTVSTNFGAIALVGAVLATLTAAVLHLALERMRADRRGLELLITATAKLDTSLDPQQTLRRIASTALPDLAELCVVDLLDEEGTVTTSVAASVDPALALCVEAIRRDQQIEALPNHSISQVLRGRRPHVLTDLTEAPALLEAIDGAGEQSKALAGGSATIIPMVARGRLLGVISFVHAAGAQAGQQRVLEDLTGRAALAFDNARLYAERAAVAQTLRRSLMPAALPRIPGLELESYFRPTGSGSEVGGDFYDVFGDEKCCWMVVGDVCGKGAEAAVLTAFLRHTTAAYTRDGSGPASVLSRVNEAMLNQDFEGRFATAILARLTFGPAGVALTVAAAGHPSGLLSREDGTTEELGDNGTLLGVFHDAHIGEASTVLRPGDGLALYTDGLSEAQAPNRFLSSGEMLGALARSGPGSARDTVGTLLGLVDLTQGARDDIAILAVRVEGASLSDVRAA